MDPADRLEQPQVRPVQALLVGNTDQNGSPRVGHLVHRMAQPRDVTPLLAGLPHRGERDRGPARVVARSRPPRSGPRLGPEPARGPRPPQETGPPPPRPRPQRPP